MSDTNIIWVVVGLAALALVIGVTMTFARRTRDRSLKLRERFGPEAAFVDACSRGETLIPARDIDTGIALWEPKEHHSHKIYGVES